jgi:mRNA interferase RelE/StbE
MGMKFTIRYHEKVMGEDIPRLSQEWEITIKKTIDEKLTSAPEMFGKPLRRSLKGYRKLRVGDYRVIFRIEKTIVKIFVIQHRSVVYKYITKRLT